MVTTSLFHFTRSFDTLSAILVGGSFWPQFCLEDASWIRNRPTQLAFCVTCFCDIPLSKLDGHRDIFGSYGIGLSKDWGLRNGLNPVVYINKDSPIIAMLREAFGSSDHLYEALGSDAYTSAIELAAYCKPYQGIVRRKAGEVPVTFYDEHEWRYVPRTIYKTTQFFFDTIEHPEKNRLQQLSLETKRFSIGFEADDIRYIVVERNDEISAAIELIRRAFGGASESTVSRLLTRVVSLDDVGRDF